MERKLYVVLCLWLLVIAGQYYYSKSVQRFFPELVLPHFGRGNFNIDSLLVNDFQLEVEYIDGTSSFYTYHQFYNDLPEYVAQSSLHNFLDKSKKNTHQKELKEWYFNKAKVLSEHILPMTITAKSLNYRITINDFRVDTNLVKKEELFKIHYASEQ